jgi:hypothetical protein
MRALLSWDLADDDPEYDQIVMALGGTLPAGKVRALTNNTALIEPLNAKQFNALFLRVEEIATQYAGRLFFVLSLHEARGPIWGVYRGVSASFVVNTPPAGAGA